MGLAHEIISSVPVIGQAQGFIKVARNVTKATSVPDAVIGGVKTIIVECSPPQVKYPLKCFVLAVQCGVCIMSVSNPVTAPFSASLLIGLGTQILEAVTLD
jgi:hypothetical protein